MAFHLHRGLEELKPYLRDIFHSSNAYIYSYLERAPVTQLIDQFLAGTELWADAIWTLLTLEIWLQLESQASAKRNTILPALRVARVIARLNVGGPTVQAILMTKALQSRGHDAQLFAGEVPLDEQSAEYLAEVHGVRVQRIGVYLATSHGVAIWALWPRW